MTREAATKVFESLRLWLHECPTDKRFTLTRYQVEALVEATEPRPPAAAVDLLEWTKQLKAAIANFDQVESDGLKPCNGPGDQETWKFRFRDAAKSLRYCANNLRAALAAPRQSDVRRKTWSPRAENGGVKLPSGTAHPATK